MRRDLKILLGTVALGATAAWGHRVPEALGAMEAFRVVDVDVQGLRYLTRAEALEAMGVGPESSVWEDPNRWAEALRAHPLVRDAKVTRRVPDALTVVVEERQPVALVAAPVLEAVDAEGVRLPIDPADHRLDLPLLAPTGPLADGSRLLPEDMRGLAAEVGRLMSVDTAFLHMVSEVREGEGHTLVARWSDPDVDFLLPYGLPQPRLREGLVTLADAVLRARGAVPEEIDLRFADQVVVRNTLGN